MLSFLTELSRPPALSCRIPSVPCLLQHYPAWCNCNRIWHICLRKWTNMITCENRRWKFSQQKRRIRGTCCQHNEETSNRRVAVKSTWALALDRLAVAEPLSIPMHLIRCQGLTLPGQLPWRCSYPWVAHGAGDSTKLLWPAGYTVRADGDQHGISGPKCLQNTLPQVWNGHPSSGKFSREAMGVSLPWCSLAISCKVKNLNPGFTPAKGL